MKTTTKFLASAVAAAAIFFTTNVNAQSNLGIGVNIGAPTESKYSFGIGADIRYQINTSKQLSIPITTGYSHFLGKELVTGVQQPDYGYIPVKAGLKYFFNPTGSGLYGLAEAGAAFGVTEDSGTSFVYSPAVGYAWSNGLDLGVKYEGMARTLNNTDHVALRIAYGFKL
jgi:hypothetical protein